ncbi:hypothetical protein [Methylovirgula sp. HY1]|uniref:hypothetical protein n=1 Tax=Methylovirgula sp. HY1 TaxID=2822761 RepID=UPI001C5ABC52|nr:hypothetical protein [Methylovirgula sp. HY1]
MAAADRETPSRQTKALSPELIASLLQSEAAESATQIRRAGKVRRSFRAAILAGLIVAILNAAASATFAAHAMAGLHDFSLGSAQVPVAAALIIGALWSGGSSSATCLLVVHRLLARMGRTSYSAYVLGGGAVALTLSLIMFPLDGGQGPRGLALVAVSGMVTGYFYRLFAGTIGDGA